MGQSKVFRSVIVGARVTRQITSGGFTCIYISYFLLVDMVRSTSAFLNISSIIFICRSFWYFLSRFISNSLVSRYNAFNYYLPHASSLGPSSRNVGSVRNRLGCSKFWTNDPQDDNENSRIPLTNTQKPSATLDGPRPHHGKANTSRPNATVAKSPRPNPATVDFPTLSVSVRRWSSTRQNHFQTLKQPERTQLINYLQPTSQPYDPACGACKKVCFTEAVNSRFFGVEACLTNCAATISNCPVIPTGPGGGIPCLDCFQYCQKKAQGDVAYDYPLCLIFLGCKGCARWWSGRVVIIDARGD